MPKNGHKWLQLATIGTTDSIALWKTVNTFFDGSLLLTIMKMTCQLYEVELQLRTTGISQVILLNLLVWVSKTRAFTLYYLDLKNH